METDAEIEAWLRLMAAVNTQNGHDRQGRGSPVTQTIIDELNQQYEPVFEKVKGRELPIE